MVIWSKEILYIFIKCLSVISSLRLQPLHRPPPRPNAVFPYYHGPPTRWKCTSSRLHLRPRPATVKLDSCRAGARLFPYRLLVAGVRRVNKRYSRSLFGSKSICKSGTPGGIPEHWTAGQLAAGLLFRGRFPLNCRKSLDCKYMRGFKVLPLLS